MPSDASIEQLLATYGALLRAVISRHCPSHAGVDPAEVEQEARVRVWRALTRGVEIEDPARYIHRVAVNASVDALRRLRARREDPLPETAGGEPAREPPALVADASETPEAIAQRQELMTAVQSAVASLAANRRRAVELHLQGMTLAEVAALTGWSEPKARNLIHRGMADLRAALVDAGIEA